jgi:hypothetical protein
MEEKWAVWVEDNQLLFCRSWTGMLSYVARLTDDGISGLGISRLLGNHEWHIDAARSLVEHGLIARTADLPEAPDAMVQAVTEHALGIPDDSPPPTLPPLASLKPAWTTPSGAEAQRRQALGLDWVSTLQTCPNPACRLQIPHVFVLCPRCGYSLGESGRQIEREMQSALQQAAEEISHLEERIAKRRNKGIPFWAYLLPAVYRQHQQSTLGEPEGELRRNREKTAILLQEIQRIQEAFARTAHAAP